jgi:diguanylate cyclase (GGDEF)-like protein/PAS domain S-box-containing protein
VANFTYDWETWRGPDNTYLYVSPSCERITGHTVAEFLADSNLVIKIADPDDLPKIKEHFGASFNGSKREDLNLDFRIITPDGKTRWIGHSCTAVFGEDGQWWGRRESNRDITTRKLAEMELQYMKESLESANIELKAALIREQQLARTDALTGVNSRGYLRELAAREFELSARYQQPLSMLMVDIDDFKNVNDTFGHAIGDQAIQCVSQIISAEIRSPDIVGRYGAGDEFTILVPQTSAQEALPLAERIHASVNVIRMETDKGALTLTISIGIAQTLGGSTQLDTVENLFLRADQALYAVKQSGKNNTMIFNQE